MFNEHTHSHPKHYFVFRHMILLPSREVSYGHSLEVGNFTGSYESCKKTKQITKNKLDLRDITTPKGFTSMKM